MRSLLQAWKVFTIRAEDLQEVGDTVLVAVVQGGAGITSGIESEMRYFQLWTFRGGKIIRIESIPDADEAHDAAGLPRADEAHTT